MYASHEEDVTYNIFKKIISTIQLDLDPNTEKSNQESTKMSEIYPNIYINSGASIALPALYAKNISHILNIVPSSLNAESQQRLPASSFKQLKIVIDGTGNKLNLAQHFPVTNEFISGALENDNKSKMLINCPSSAEISKTIVCAYLLKKKCADEPEILDKVGESNGNSEAIQNQVESVIDSIFKSNGDEKSTSVDSFIIKQLNLYLSCKCPNTIEELSENKEYIKWLSESNSESNDVNAKSSENNSESCSQNSDSNTNQDKPLNSETKASHDQDSPSPTTEKPVLTQLRCKKCRAGLASSKGFLIHAPETFSSYANSNKRIPFQPTLNGAPRNGMFHISSIPPQCMHYYMEPAAWMRAELDKGDPEGRFVCPNPKCKAKVGTYSWHGDKCSCGKWITPAIGLLRARVDEVPVTQNP